MEASNREDAAQRKQQQGGDVFVSFSSVKLQKLSHLADYLGNLQSYTNPLENNRFFRPSEGFYLTDSDVILRQIVYDLSGAYPSPSPNLAYNRAGPRKRVYFDPSLVRAAIVACGGLFPGLNTVIRELVLGLWDLYGVRDILGIRAGYRGFYSVEPPMVLNPKVVHDWHKKGGTVLETSRGGFYLENIVDAIENHGFNQRTLGRSIADKFWGAKSLKPYQEGSSGQLGRRWWLTGVEKNIVCGCRILDRAMLGSAVSIRCLLL